MLEQYFPEFTPKPLEERWNGIWWNSNLVNKIHILMAQGGWSIGKNGKLTQKHLSGNFDIPWIFVPHPEANFNMHCYIWKEALFDCVLEKAFIPAYCRVHCHKVVVVMPTVQALFQWYPIMQRVCNECGQYGKLGVDRRDYTSARYAAFFYCIGLDSGRVIKDVVEKALLDAHIADARWKVILKKGCTEMDAALPSDKWGTPSDDDLHFEEQFYDIFEVRKPLGANAIHTQQPWLKNRIMFEWLDFARRTGDASWKEVIPKSQEYVDTLFGKMVQAVTY